MRVVTADAARVAVDELSQAGEARRVATSIAQRIGLDGDTVGRVALVATELATNLARHARDGEILLRSLEDGAQPGVELIAIDRAPGIADLPRAFEDGYSTAGSSGQGLGAAKRLSTSFDILSEHGKGTIIRVEIWACDPALRPFEIGAISVAHPSEARPGDAWALRPGGSRIGLVVTDGLGHGPDAAAAALESIRVFNDRESGPAECIEIMHRVLAHTRGAAVARAELDLERRVVTWASVGNVVAAVWSHGKVRNLIAHDGTVGHSARKIEEYAYPWTDDAVLVVATDGIGRFDLDAHPGLTAHHPGVIAAAIYREARRPRDDATVVVVRERRP